MLDKNDLRKSILSNGVRNSFFGNKKKLDETVLLNAISGDTMAIMTVVDTYQAYINKLSLRVVINDNGECKEEIDETVKRTLETSLIAAILKFNPNR